MTLDRTAGDVGHRRFAELPAILREGDLLVRNDVRVRPARLYGRDTAGRLVEIFLLEKRDSEGSRWLALAKPGRRAKRGGRIAFDEGVSAEVMDVADDGTRTVAFDRPIDEALLERIGRTPLPPYIRREAGSLDRPEDRAAYQTVFAREPLAVAAPTAGLHFTRGDPLRRSRPRRRDRRPDPRGRRRHLQAGDVRRHRRPRVPARARPHPGSDARGDRPRARSEGRRVVAVGTTVARSLEAAAAAYGRSAPRGPRFETDLFITPGFEFRAVDALLTNFHLPRSTLLMLVSAFAGRERDPCGLRRGRPGGVPLLLLRRRDADPVIGATGHRMTRA